MDHKKYMSQLGKLSGKSRLDKRLNKLEELHEFVKDEEMYTTIAKWETKYIDTLLKYWRKNK